MTRSTQEDEPALLARMAALRYATAPDKLLRLYASHAQQWTSWRADARGGKTSRFRPPRPACGTRTWTRQALDPAVPPEYSARSWKTGRKRKPRGRGREEAGREGKEEAPANQGGGGADPRAKLPEARACRTPRAPSLFFLRRAALQHRLPCMDVVRRAAPPRPPRPTSAACGHHHRLMRAIHQVRQVTTDPLQGAHHPRVVIEVDEPHSLHYIKKNWQKKRKRPRILQGKMIAPKPRQHPNHQEQDRHQKRNSVYQTGMNVY